MDNLRAYFDEKRTLSHEEQDSYVHILIGVLSVKVPPKQWKDALSVAKQMVESNFGRSVLLKGGR